MKFKENHCFIISYKGVSLGVNMQMSRVSWYKRH